MDKTAIIKALRDTAQSASNTVAENASIPVDAIAWALRKAGAKIDTPVGGSEWMAQKGLTAPVDQGLPKMAGEFLGNIVPAVGFAKAPQIAAGMNRMVNNAMAPTTLNKQKGAILFHGTSHDMPIKGINSGGMFASQSEKSAKSHGPNVYRMTVPDEQIMNRYGDVEWDSALNTVNKELSGNPMSEEIADMALSNKDVWQMSDDELQPILEALGKSDLADASWELQRIRGQIAKDAGFKAAAMPDEHGMSYMVFQGTNPRPHSQEAKDLFRKK